MTDDILVIETDERVRTLTLNRPQSRNALSSALRDRFFGALTDAETDDDVDVVILTGADPVFCAGLDLKELGGQAANLGDGDLWPVSCALQQRSPAVQSRVIELVKAAIS